MVLVVDAVVDAVVEEEIVVGPTKTIIRLPIRMEIINEVVVTVVVAAEEEEEAGDGVDETLGVVVVAEMLRHHHGTVVEAAFLRIDPPIGKPLPRPHRFCTPNQPVVVPMAPIGWPNARPNNRNRNVPNNKPAQVNWNFRNNKNNNEGPVSWKH